MSQLSINVLISIPFNDIMISRIHKAFKKLYYNQKSPKNGFREVRTPYCTQINNTCEFVTTLKDKRFAE